MGLGTGAAAVLAACGETQIVTMEIPVEKTVIKEVPVETIVTRTQIKEVPVEKIVTSTQIKEVPVDRVVTKEVPVDRVVIKQVPVEKVVTRQVTVEKIVEVERKPRALPALESAPQLRSATLRFGNDWVSGARGIIMKSSIEEFERRNPQITINQEPQAQAWDKQIIMLMAGTAPEVQAIDGYIFALFGDKFYDLAPLLQRDGIARDEWTPTARPINRGEGVDATPFQVGGTAWAANVNLFDNAGVALPSRGWSWDEMLETGKRLTDAETGVWGIWSTPDYFNGVGVMMRQLGGELFADDYTRTAIADGDAIQAWHWWADLIFKHHVAPEQAQQTAATQGLQGNVFTLQKTAIRTANAGVVGRLLLLKDDFESAIIPVAEVAQPVKLGTASNNLAHAMPTATELIEESWAWNKFLVDDFVQDQIAVVRGSSPSTVSVLNSDKYQSPPPANMEEVVRNLLDPGLSDPDFTVGWLEWWRAWTPKARKIWTEGVNVEEGVQETVDVANETLKLRIRAPK